MYRLRFLITLSLIFITTSHAFAEELLVYSGRKAKFVKPFIEEFSKQTGIKVKLRSGSSSILLSSLSLRGEQTGVDIYLGNDVGNLQRGSDFGLFRKLPAELVNIVPAKYRSPNNDWISLSARLRVLVVNTNNPDHSKIDSVMKLADTALKGRIAITHSNNESFISGVSSYRHVLKPKQYKEWLQGIKANAEGHVYRKHSHIVKAVAQNKRAVGLVNHYYALRHMKKHPDAPIKLVIPDQKTPQMGVAWNLSGIAITRFSKQPRAAERLVAFLLSADKQKQFAEINQEYPSRPGVVLAKGVPAINTMRLIKTPIEEIGRQREETINEIHAIGLR